MAHDKKKTGMKTTGTSYSHRHLLCRHQYNCDDTDHSQRHLRCKHKYNCGAITQLDTLSGPLQTRSPLWRALRRTRGRLRTVANTCGRLPTVAVANAKLGEHSLTPRPPNETGTLATHSGKRGVMGNQCLEQEYGKHDRQNDEQKITK